MSQGPEPTPAVGINSDFITDQPRVLTIRGEFMSSKTTISLEDGSPLFTCSADHLSMSRRQHLIDARSRLELFELRKEKWSKTYFVDHPDGGEKRILEVEIQMAFFGGPTLFVDFLNVANGGAPVRLECKVHSFDRTKTVMWNDRPVAEIEAKSMSLRGESTVRLAAGVDPLPILALVMALADRARQKNSTSAAAGGGAAAAGAGGGGGGC